MGSVNQYSHKKTKKRPPFYKALAKQLLDNTVDFLNYFHIVQIKHIEQYETVAETIKDLLLDNPLTQKECFLMIAYVCELLGLNFEGTRTKNVSKLIEIQVKEGPESLNPGEALLILAEEIRGAYQVYWNPRNNPE